MPLEIGGHLGSTCTQRIATVINELGLQANISNAAWSELKTDEWLKKQPFGQMPYLDDEGFVVYESRAICRYLAVKSGSDLVPTGDIKTVAQFEQACSVESFDFDPYASGLITEKVFKKMFGGEANDTFVQKYDEVLQKRLVGYERILSKQQYLAGDKLTLADLFHLPYGALLPQAGYNYLSDAETYPNVARWWKEISERESWKQVESARGY